VRTNPNLVAFLGPGVVGGNSPLKVKELKELKELKEPSSPSTTPDACNSSIAVTVSKSTHPDANGA